MIRPCLILIWCLKIAAELSCIGCPQGFWYHGYNYSAGQCRNCPKNFTTFENQNASSPYECSCNSTFFNVSDFCVSCSFHTFKSDIGNFSCTNCPANSATLQEGSFDIHDCLCNPGFAGDETEHECFECNKGKFKSTVSDALCDICPPNTFCPRRQMIEPNRCASNSSSLAGSDYFFDCACNVGFHYDLSNCIPDSTPSTFTTVSVNEDGAPYFVLDQIMILTIGQEVTVDWSATADTHPFALSTTSAAPYELPGDDIVTQNIDTTAKTTTLTVHSADTSLYYMCQFGHGFQGVKVNIRPLLSQCDLECTQCAEGKYNDIVNQSSCISCPNNTFNPHQARSNLSDCLACPANSASPPESIAIETCICNLGYAGNPGEECIECAPGTYLDSLHIYECLKCPANTFNELFAQVAPSSCLACGHNKTSITGSGSEFACVCDPGFEFERRDHRFDCHKCAVGKFSNVSNTSSCAACGTGTFNDDIAKTVCLQCADGKYSDIVGQTACVSCEAGKYQDTSVPNVKSYQCTFCPENSFHNFTQSILINDCTCNAGYRDIYVSGAFDSCALCEPGSFCPGEGQQFLCDKNHFSQAGATSCTQCHPNSHGGQIVNYTECLCLAGTEGRHHDDCTLCLPGTVQPTNFSGLPCQDCARGFYQELPGKLECNSCSPNSNTDSTGSDDVRDCKCMQSFFGPDGDVCRECPANFYCPGGNVINECPLFTLSENKSFHIRNCTCRPGFTAPINGVQCSACPRNFYCPGGTAQIACSNNSHSKAGSKQVEACICNAGLWRGCIQASNGTFLNQNGLCTIQYELGCVACGEDVICINNTLEHCPAFSTSLPKSSEPDDCVCDDGFYAVHDSHRHAIDVATHIVALSLTLPYTVATFDSEKQQTFKASIANVAQVTIDDVSIDNIEAITVRRRRLFSDSIRVDVTIKAGSNSQADAMSSLLTVTNINAEIEATLGVQATIFSAPVKTDLLGQSSQSTPAPPPPTRGYASTMQPPWQHCNDNGYFSYEADMSCAYFTFYHSRPQECIERSDRCGSYGFLRDNQFDFYHENIYNEYCVLQVNGGYGYEDLITNCCGCGGGTRDLRCMDKQIDGGVKWTDVDSYSCLEYEMYDLRCNEAQQFANHGMTALEACCVCGGGGKAPVDSDGDGSISTDELTAYQSVFGGSGDLTSIDSNGDGVVSETEFNTYTSSAAAADSDGDGSISLEELTAYQGVNGGSGELSSIDSDGDGVVSETEFNTYKGSMAAADSDGDGTISSEELTLYQDVNGGSGSLASIDSDGDGVVSETEFNTYKGSMPAADSDGDGSLSADELIAYQETHGGSESLTSLDSDGDGVISENEFQTYTEDTVESSPLQTTTPVPSTPTTPVPSTHALDPPYQQCIHSTPEGQILGDGQCDAFLPQFLDQETSGAPDSFIFGEHEYYCIDKADHPDLSFSGYAQFCCWCGGGTRDSRCTDDTSWQDSRSWGCWAYETRLQLCDTADNFANADGISAKSACCACGGGTISTSSSDSPALDPPYQQCTDSTPEGQILGDGQCDAFMPHFLDQATSGAPDSYIADTHLEYCIEEATSSDPTYSGYALYCCWCGGGNYDTRCTSDTSWLDSRSWGCWAYETRPQLCDTGGNFVNADGVSAETACCICGGGQIA